jgi:hypothetical protein
MCASGMDGGLGVRVSWGPYWREPRVIGNCAAVRSGGMEARSESQHRTKVKPRKAGPTWVSVHSNATPYFQSWRDGSGDGGGETSFILTPRELPWPANAVDLTATSGRRLVEKSDHLVVVTKPGNAGGAKGVTG